MVKNMEYVVFVQLYYVTVVGVEYISHSLDIGIRDFVKKPVYLVDFYTVVLSIFYNLSYVCGKTKPK